MTTPEQISIIISFVSLIVAAISWFISHRVDKRMLAIEEKREQDRLATENTGRVKVILTTSDQFLINNEGSIDIEITEIFLNGIEIREHPCFENFKQAPIKIPAGNFYSAKFYDELSLEEKYRPPYDVTVKWITKNGDKQQQTMTVNWI